MCVAGLSRRQTKRSPANDLGPCSHTDLESHGKLAATGDFVTRSYADPGRSKVKGGRGSLCNGIETVGTEQAVAVQRYLHWTLHRIPFDK